jgi:hypothetical protein
VKLAISIVFETPDKLAAFAGIDPIVKQSGHFSAT